MQRIAVIGGGITGITSAYALAKRGYEVTVFEKHRYAAMETSFANGGQLSASNAEVWNHWPTVIKGLRWMLRNDAPLLVNPRPSWHKLSWFGEFIAAIPKYAANTTETARLAIAAREHLFQWAKDEQIDFDLKQKGILHIYRDKAGYDHAAKVSQLLSQGGLERQPVTPEEMRAIEPTLAGNYYGGFFTESDATGDIHKFTHGLAQAAERRGVTLKYGHSVQDIGADEQHAWITASLEGEADGEPVRETFDSVVVCAGVGSRALAAKLGDRVNIYPVKGYSITVQLDDAASQQAAPTVSLLDDETKLVTSRLGDERFRIAGTAEFNGFNRDIRDNRIRPLIRWVEECFPGVSTRRVIPWAGLRPMLPNMLPKVGPGKLPTVFYNTGHGHLGWTLSAITADMLADAVEAKNAQSDRSTQPLA
ncbi:D-amino-acid dehydrogenase [Vreelandella subterranea]|uniref:D-amino-acid dehydrogenase n=1 Tax=Vreelandella subterranea TaxID=416874 RepID=A0A1H9PF33_9GAMM|nr:D-amino acid dehydrogenase [Halomonas subterranea]SER46792.1 D-amino-acid dehydrogenase [Halomonas subterranea]